MTNQMFTPLKVERRTGETCFGMIVRPRVDRAASMPLPNRLLSHFIDHFSKACGMAFELVRTDWPGSWALDHVLCEDMGQLTGRAVAGVLEELVRTRGAAGRATAQACMDDAESRVTVSFESRASVAWEVPRRADINGFVDAWYDEKGRMAGWASGTNLRQYVDGFSYGSGASVSIGIIRAGNLHHVYETVFRALGDAVGEALGLRALTPRLPGDSSGLAGAPVYTAEALGEE